MRSSAIRPSRSVKASGPRPLNPFPVTSIVTTQSSGPSPFCDVDDFEVGLLADVVGAVPAAHTVVAVEFAAPVVQVRVLR